MRSMSAIRGVGVGGLGGGIRPPCSCFFLRYRFGGSGEVVSCEAKNCEADGCNVEGCEVGGCEMEVCGFGTWYLGQSAMSF